jgi:hypothetical protein
MEEEDGIEPAVSFLTHVTVARDFVEVALSRIVEATDREMHHVVRLFERHEVRIVLRTRGGGVREQRVIRRIEALHELLIDSPNVWPSTVNRAG